jgi:hypothetical protein
MPRKRLFPPLDPSTGRRLENKGRDDFTVLTVNGRITLWRRRWSSPATGSLTPLDALLDVAEARLTIGVRELACRLNQASRNFDKAAENLARAAQVVLSGELLRQVVEAEGRGVLHAQQAGTLLLGWTAADCRVPTAGADATPPANAVPTVTPPAHHVPTAPPPANPHDGEKIPPGGDTANAVPTVTPPAHHVPTPPSPATVATVPVVAGTRVYLGSDGVKVPLITDSEKQQRRQKVKQKRRRRGKKCRPLPKAKPGADQRYKEFKIVTYYDDTQAHRHVSVTQGDCEVAGQLMRRDAGRIRLDAAADKVAIIDGAPWIRNQIAGQNLPIEVIELDFYHLSDNVHKARRAVYGEEAALGQEWAAQVLHTAKHEGYAALRDELVAWKGRLRGVKKRQAAETLLGYVTDRREMVAYPEYLAAGRQIGSGPTESMCKTTTARLKGSGMRWDAANAEALMALDALDQSGEWKLYWKMRLRRVA